MKSKRLLPATLGNECVRSTHGEIRIAPAGRDIPWSRNITSILINDQHRAVFRVEVGFDLRIMPPPAESPANTIVEGS